MRLSPKVEFQGLVLRLGHEVGSRGWIPRLVSKDRSQSRFYGMVPRLVAKKQFQGILLQGFDVGRANN